MGFRNPITTAADPTARAAASAAQQAAAAAQAAASGAAQAAAAAQITANTANTAAGTAQQTASTALTTANGKNRIYVGNPAPAAPTGGFTVDDQWVDTGNGNRINVWDGTAWTPLPIGQGALAANAVTASTIAAGAIDGKVITGATLRTAATGQRVQIDSTNGLVGYNTAGTAVTQVRPSDGALVATGATITGVLDTGISPADPGVKVYTAAGNPGSGAIQWRTRATTAAIQLLGSDTGSGGATFSIVGGSSGGITPPELDLNVEQPAGGYTAVARIRNAATVDLGGAQLTGATAKPVAPIAFSWNDTTWGNYGAGLENVYFRFDPITSRVYATGLCRSTAGPYASGWKVLTISSSKYWPGASVWVPVAYGGGVAHGGAYMQPTGLFVLDVIQAGYSPPAGTAVHLSFSWAVAGT